MARNLEEHEKLDKKHAETIYILLRMAIAGTGVPGKVIAKEAGISDHILRQYTAKSRAPSKAIAEALIRALKKNGVTMDLDDRSVRLTRPPKHIPGAHKGAKDPA